MNATKTFDYGISKARINKFSVPADEAVIIELYDRDIAFVHDTNSYSGVVGFTISTDKDILFNREYEEITKKEGEGVINKGSKIFSLEGKPQIFPYDSHAIKLQSVSEVANVEILEIYYADVGVG